MTFSNNMHYDAFNLPSEVKLIVCCDVDETYIPYSDNHKALSGVKDLENFMNEYGVRHGILLGWISGSNLDSILNKSKGYISRSPHFICCSLGSEFYWIKEKRLEASESWMNQIINSGYKKENIGHVVDILTSKRIHLVSQPASFQGEYKQCFYYKINENMQKDFDLIASLANDHRLRAIFTKCNPAAGDPADCWDVEFIPTCCGKDATISFLQSHFNVNKDGIYAFGDSFNDFTMLHAAGNGYLVGNADPAAKLKFNQILKNNYCMGILDILREVVS